MRRHIRRTLLALPLAAVATITVAWSACFLPVPAKYNYNIAGEGQEWTVIWGGNTGLRWESVWCLSTPYQTLSIRCNEGEPDAHLRHTAEQTAAALPTEDFRDTPLGRRLHLDAAPAITPPQARDTSFVLLRRAGWPAPCLYGYQSTTDARRPGAAATTHGLAKAPRSQTLLPWLPLVPGMLLNLAFYTALFWLPLLGLSTLRRAWRRKRNRCPECNYDLRGLRSAGDTAIICPECGSSSSRKAAVQP